MPTLAELADQHQKARIKTIEATSVRALRLWRQGVQVGDLDGSWDAVAPAVVAQVTAGQVYAANQATDYTDRVSKLQDFDQLPSRLVPEAFGGVMLDGREIGPALFGAVTTTKTLIGRGIEPARAFRSGAAFLSVIAKAAVADMGRQADIVKATGAGYTRYIRVISPGACSRCAILAGSSSYEKAFERHPACKCTTAPIKETENAPDGFYDSPEAYFESLSEADQDRVFTKSGAFAIRNGADPISVVNARRGALTGGGLNGSPSRLVKTTIGRKADGSPLQVYLTSEGTTARGVFGRRELRLTEDYTKTGRYRRTTTVRLMPEQIQIMAGGDPARARELLSRYGYLTRYNQ